MKTTTELYDKIIKIIRKSIFNIKVHMNYSFEFVLFFKNEFQPPTIQILD